MNSTEVAIIKSSSPSGAITDGIEKLGGISGFVENGDQVFVKINLRTPGGFPVNNNFETIKTIINFCKEAEAKKIFVGSYPFNGFKTDSVAKTLGIQSYIEKLGAEFVFLDDQNKYPLKSVEINGKTIDFSKVILESDRLILLNQVSVDPLFKCTISLLNTYSLVSNQFQKIQKNVRSGKDYLHLDQYKQDLITNILDIFSVKKPSLVINDLFYFLEGAGPFIYKDSNLKRTNLIVVGNDAVAVDLITLRLFEIDLLNSDILLEARNRRLGITDIPNIRLIGENLEDIKLTVDFCVSKLEDINLKNTYMKAGRICSGCFKEAYHLLNLMKTHMTKDLKYIIKQSFLVGEKPPKPESLENIILFGDCAIESTENREFRKTIITNNKDYVEIAKKKLKKDYKAQDKTKVKERVNKKIVELPGCPPSRFDCLNSLISFYGKGQVPNLFFFNNLIKTYYNQETDKKTK
ncbi:hypothetical protein ES705_31442 [subsurface metagenome]